MAKVLPNFLYIGADKAGSTWLHRVLSWHPEIYLYPGKDIYFFDRYYGRGREWYERCFDGARSELIVGEISHDYLFSREACVRIREMLPAARLMACIRNPLDRALSAYRYVVKHGFSGSFAAAAEKWPPIVENGLYGKHLRAYLDHFDRDRMHIAFFDDLVTDSTKFATDIFAFLGVKLLPIPGEMTEGIWSAARPRVPALAAVVKRVAVVARDVGLGTLVGRLKQSDLLQWLLYRPYRTEEAPRIEQEALEDLRRLYGADIQTLDQALGTQLVDRWNLR